MTGRDERTLLRMAARDPATAFTRALALLEDGGGVLPLRVAGLAAKELGRLDEGLAFLRRALELASGSDPYAAAQVRMNLVGLLTASGDVTEALAHARRAETVLSGPDADRLAANKAGALARAGRLEEAHQVAVQALPRLRAGQDPAALNGLLTNLGLARVFRGDYDGAEEALAEAVAVGEAAGLRHQTAMAKGNLAFTVSRRGDVPRALRLFAEAEQGLTGERLAQCRFDQAETLIMAGLPGEARPVLTAALDAATANGYRCDTADGYLLLAHAELADGNAEEATVAAERARTEFTGQERMGWALLAEHVLLKARWASGERSAVLLRSAAATAERLESGGWADAADEARIVAARVALSLGRPAGHLLASVRRTSGPASGRIAAWHAIALEHSARDARKGALAAVRAGLEVTEEHAEALDALDLRARAAGLATELAELGLRLSGSARELLAVEERRRAIARPVRVRPPRDPERAAALTALRALSVDRTADTARGGAPAAPPADLTALEARIRERTRRRPSGASPDRPAAAGEVAAELGDRALVELIAIGDELHAVTVAGGRARRHRLGPGEGARRETGLLRFAARRLAEDGGPPAPSALTGAAERLDRLLLAPLRPVLGDRELVIAPTGVLHGLPWATLPSLAGRPFTVVPSAGAWLHARRRAPSGGHAVLVAGPDLLHADREIAALRRLHPGAVVLDGPDARAEPVRDALEGAALAHVAAHGEFHQGNALFSRLRLADGPLMVHDLDELADPPHLIVLSACDIGRADEGDAVLGMAGALLALGTATVIASVLPVRDDATAAFMTAFHTALAAGKTPSRALAAITRAPATTGFLAMGAG
ncbi:tetratricopeptide (TPR) repeat protein [Actinomadura luteofluorescens]|uniref:Tetratricopeptide (TPR) repeat protein n=1 Tax=Actinomadura luteofluorescens TaxID=46163 RepID=A0A7Y9EMU8_9ACTN|nr:CHAT domain-containing protein [Actinomadura luteofluorescens]NYD50682.1 tetratricopeptide (TPR) repeat protein [Actinomadura luteofluorescens]